MDAAVDIVEKSGGQYHVLVIIADGQVTSLSHSPPAFSCGEFDEIVICLYTLTHFINELPYLMKVTRSVNTSDAELSQQEEKTINSIVNAR